VESWSACAGGAAAITGGFSSSHEVSSKIATSGSMRPTADVMRTLHGRGHALVRATHQTASVSQRDSASDDLGALCFRVADYRPAGRMADAMLTYVKTIASEEVPAESGAKLTAETYLVSTSTDKKEQRKNTVLKCCGEVGEMGRTWEEEWTFDWPDKDDKKLEQVINHLQRYVDTRIPRSGLPTEAYVDVYPWLRVSWIDTKDSWSAVIRISKDERSMTTKVKDMGGLWAFRTCVGRALQS
jgi:hypothetical protein